MYREVGILLMTMMEIRNQEVDQKVKCTLGCQRYASSCQERERYYISRQRVRRCFNAKRAFLSEGSKSHPGRINTCMRNTRSSLRMRLVGLPPCHSSKRKKTRSSR